MRAEKRRLRRKHSTQDNTSHNPGRAANAAGARGLAGDEEIKAKS